jgi:Na+/melibiose symporter-like transporter
LACSEPPPTVIIGAAHVGFDFAGAITTKGLIGAKIKDEDARKRHFRRQDIIHNAQGFMEALNNLLNAAVFSLAMTLSGFENRANPGRQPDQAARFLQTVFLSIMILISFGFSFLRNSALRRILPPQL